MPFADKVAVVTGAAGDIGAAVARALWERGTALLAVDDDADKLDSLGRELGGA